MEKKNECAITEASKELDKQDLTKISEVVDDLFKSIKQLEQLRGSDLESMQEMEEQIVWLRQALEEVRLAYEDHTTQETHWKNRRIVGLLDRITIVIGSILALIATFFAGKGMLK